MEIIPQSHVILAYEDDVENRLNFAKKIYEELGIKKFGFEFLFMKEEHLENLNKSKQRAGEVKERLEDIGFEELYFSIHFPWMPYHKFNLDEDINLDYHKKIADFKPDMVSVINLHVQNDAPIKEFLNNYNTYDKKLKSIDNVLKNIEKLAQYNRFCIENMVVPNVTESVDYINTVPFDIEYFLKIKGIGFTLDTCHSGIVVDTSKKILYKEKSIKDYNGLYPEEMKDIVELGEFGDLAFPKADHIHLSDFNIPEIHGVVPGQGKRSIEYYRIFFKEYFKNSKGKIGVVLEIGETDFINNPNTYESFKVFKEIFTYSP